MKYLSLITILFLLASSCGPDNKPLNKQEEKAVQTQVEKDNAAMDSLEKAIQAQINGDTFNLKKNGK